LRKLNYFFDKELKKSLLDEYLQSTFKLAGYGGLKLVHTPMGTRITIFALRPGLIIGRRGIKIRQISGVIENDFGYENPVISVGEIAVPEFEPQIMAWQISKMLGRGYRHRRVGFQVLKQIMEAGAEGADIVIKGKLRTQRSGFERFSDGTLLKSGELARERVKFGKAHVLLKQGLVGIRVRIAPKIQEPDEDIKETDTTNNNVTEKPVSDKKIYGNAKNIEKGEKTGSEKT